jgi:type II secretory pathway component PulK
MNRRGFALVAVMWLIVSLSVLAMGVTVSARDFIDAARNRIALVRAAWIAEGCAEQARAELDRALAAGIPWEGLGREISPQIVAGGCDARMTATGSALDVNHAGAEQLTRLLEAAGVRSWPADSLTDAILDWRDADGAPRAFGAESAWYRSRGRIQPRNGKLADGAELYLVRGFPESGIDGSLLGTESGRIPINLAPLPVVASLPGMSTEILEALNEKRRSGRALTELAQLGAGVSTMARDTLFARFAELSALATIEPEAWLLEISADAGTPGMNATVQLKLSRGPGRTLVARKKTW